MTKILTQDRLKHLALYVPETGKFFYRNRFHKKLNGREIEVNSPVGYIQIDIDGVLYAAHRLAWLYMTGQFPLQTIDHKDLNKANNCWANLREATRSQQKANSNKRSDSMGPYKGVSWRPRQKKWSANVSCNGKRHHLGYFETAEKARAAYSTAASVLFGEFARAS